MNLCLPNLSENGQKLKPLLRFRITLSVSIFSLLGSFFWGLSYESIRQVVYAESSASVYSRYVSKPLGFEIDLPVEWRVNEYRNVGFGFTFLSPDRVFDTDGTLLKGSYITVRVYDPTLDPRDFTPQQALESGVRLTVDGYPGVMYSSIPLDQDSRVTVDVYQDNTLYRFQLYYHKDDSKQEVWDEILDNILQSLVFIDRSGELPVRKTEVSLASVVSAFPSLDFPFTAGNDWRITGGGGYQNGNFHEGYAKYALDFERADRNMRNEWVLSPTSGTVKHIDSSPCFYISIAQVSSTEDLFLELCHVVWESYLSKDSHLQKGQVWY